MVGKLHKTALLMQTSKNFTNFITRNILYYSMFIPIKNFD